MTAGGELVLNVRGGARVCVPADVRQYTPYVLLEQEDWFEDEIRFVRRWLREGMRAVDAGASYGVYTLAMARAVRASGRVWAFEPTAEVAAYLERSVLLNGLRNVTVRRAAVSDGAGSIEFASGAYPELNAVGGQGTATRVDAVTLDEQGWSELDFLKIDIEGHEAQAIRGAERLLRDASPLVMLEIKAQARFDMSALRLLAGMGYRAYRLLPGPLVLVPMDMDEPVSEYQLNAFACKANRAAQLMSEGFLATPERMGSLNEALGRLVTHKTVEGRLAYARAAADAGRRTEAVDALRQAILRIEEGREQVTTAVKCGALEAFERLRTFSSCFNPEPVIVDAIVALPGHAPEMQRRRQLMRMKEGTQDGPEPAPGLARAWEENLNPEFWAGRA